MMEPSNVSLYPGGFAMTWRIRRCLLVSLALSTLLSVCPGGAFAQARGTPAAKPVTLPLTFEHTLRSRINGRTYVIQVALPFATARPGGDSLRFPALYLLDGDWALPPVAAALRRSGTGGSSGVVMVGVGYPPGTTLGMPPPGGGETDYRFRDYTPPHIPDSLPRPTNFDAHPEIGGAALFLRVLKEEIIPFVERTYPVNSDRGLYGHSLGGAFALYVLLEDPDAFSRYAISSASYWWDNRSWILRERNLWKRRSGLEKRVYVSVGEFESSYQDLERNRLVVTLCAGRFEGAYQGVNLTTERIPGIGHQSFLHLLYAAQALYPDAANLDPPNPTLPNPCQFR
jgi:predicted alpha/beta superfamily hydrolase